MSSSAHKRDTCKIGVYTAPTAPSPTPTYPLGSAIRCRYAHIRARETTDGSQAVLTDSRIRVPRGTTVRACDRIQFTKKKGVTLSPAENYKTVGEPHDNGAEIVCECVRIEGSALG